MKVVVAHNFYQQPGGEDVVFQAEVDLLRKSGHDVTTYEVHNDRVKQMNRLSLLANTVWNRHSHRELLELVRTTKAEVVHFHNTFPLISPAAYRAARRGGAAVVQTLHNFRLLCPSALFYRDGKVCTECLGRSFAYPGIQHGCYRGSRLQSGVTAGAVAVHRASGTWHNAVDRYIALTESAREKFLIGGLPADKIVVKPNFVDPDPGPRAGGDYAIFVGRLSPEKGVDTLLAAWEIIGHRVPLKIVGDGPMADLVRDAVASNPSIEWLGRRAPDEIAELIGRAALLVQPSNCFETFGRVAVEAFAVGTPVVATGHGAMADVVGTDGRLGDTFAPGSGSDLAAKVLALIGHPTRLAMLRSNVRHEYEAKYTGPQNQLYLNDIYRQAIAVARGDDVSLEPAAAAGVMPL